MKALMALAALLVAGCSTTTTGTSPAGQRMLLGNISQPWCLFWCHITSTVTDGEAGAKVKGANVSETEVVTTTIQPEKK